MDFIELFQRLSVALAVGLLIGVERGWRAGENSEKDSTAGLRTFGLSGLLGGIWGAVAHATMENGGVVALGLAFTTYAAIMAVFRYREMADEGTFGATTVVATMLAFSIGALAVLGPIEVAAAAGVVVCILLTWKSLLHKWVSRLTPVELRSGFILLAMTFVLLPLLPHRTVDPWASLNPYELWLMTIMIALMSFVGYVAVKLAGDKQGIAITGIAGGLASSTAVTMTLARQARDAPTGGAIFAAGALFASAVMAGRVLVIVAAINPRMLVSVGLPIGAVGVVLATGAFLLMRGSSDSRDEGEALQLKNPFELMTVLKFGAVLGIVMFAAKVLTEWLGSAGTYAVAALSGIADTAAITLSMARSGAAETAAIAIFIAVAVNTIVKSAIAWWIGGASMGRRKALVSAIAIAAGAVGLLISAGWKGPSI
jgi:uncharacterized membrane protein (DUF4010 family)